MTALSVKAIGSLRQIWEEKCWKFPSDAESDNTFKKLCQIAERLTDSEQKLFFQLTSFYSRYSFTDYQGLLIEAISKIQTENLTGIDQVLILPLVKASDVAKNRSKSGHSLIYAAEHVGIPSNVIFDGISRNTLMSPVFKRDALKGKNILVMLVDDFVGSGETAITVVNEVRAYIAEQDKICVVALAAMQSGITCLATASVPFFWARLIPKGIEENPEIADKSQAYKLIDDIWQKNLNISKDYIRGFQDSEALVTLVRTPNNTLPMYWCAKSRDGKNWPAPFPR